MWRECVRWNWFSAVLAAALALPAASRAAATGQAPIEVETIFFRTPDGERSASRVRNVSKKEILAYVACEPHEKPRPGCGRVHVVVFATAFPPRNRLLPGELFVDRYPQGPEVKVSRLIVDYVLFADGSSWGPDSKGQAGHINGVIQGRRATIALLKRIMETQGLRAVEEILRAEQP